MIRPLRLAALALLLAAPSAVALDRGPPAQALGPIKAPSATLDTLSLGQTPATNAQGYVDLFTSPPESITAFAKDPIFSYCGYGGCTPGDTQRSNFLIRTRSKLDGTKAEIPLFVNYSVNTGKIEAWAPNTTYAVGKLINAMNTGNLYRATKGGVSAASGNGPNGQGTINDGSVIWQWVAFNQVDAKIAAVFETEMKENAGNTWGLVNNIIMRAGASRRFVVGAEFDMTNYSGNCPIDGTAFCTPMFLFGDTQFTSTAAQVISTGAPSEVKAYYFGQWWQRANGGNLIKDATIVDDTNADISIGIAQTAGRSATHAIAMLRDISTTPVSLLLNGHYGKAALDTTGADIDPSAVGAAQTAIRVKADQAICFDGANACVVWGGANGKFYFTRDNVAVMSVDGSGNIRAKGTITPNVTP